MSILAIIGRFTATTSNAIILKTKDLLPASYCIFAIYIKFCALAKEN